MFDQANSVSLDKSYVDFYCYRYYSIIFSHQISRFDNYLFFFFGILARPSCIKEVLFYPVFSVQAFPQHLPVVAFNRCICRV